MIEELIAVAEAVLARERGRLERRLQSGVARVFVRQRRAFPARRVAAAAMGITESWPAYMLVPSELERMSWEAALRKARIGEAPPPPHGTDPLWDIVAGVWPDEAERLTGVIDAVIARAAHTSAGATLARLGVDTEWTMNTQVAQRLAVRSLSAATSIEDTSRGRVRDILARGVRSRRTAVQIARDIRAEFGSWSKARAETVARTEVADAWGGTAYDVMRERGIPARVWLTAGDERVDGGSPSGPCIDNEAAGPIPVDDVFPSGHMWEPAHPRCRCTTAPYVEGESVA